VNEETVFKGFNDIEQANQVGKRQRLDLKSHEIDPELMPLAIATVIR
jgi:hypothetical protein